MPCHRRPASNAGVVTLGVDPCIELESGLRLATIALGDDQRGRAAALELLDRTLDPGDDQPIGPRDGEDGSLMLWCVGYDGIDVDGSAEDGDIVWVLPPRR